MLFAFACLLLLFIALDFLLFAFCLFFAVCLLSCRYHSFCCLSLMASHSFSRWLFSFCGFLFLRLAFGFRFCLSLIAFIASGFFPFALYFSRVLLVPCSLFDFLIVLYRRCLGASCALPFGHVFIYTGDVSLRIGLSLGRGVICQGKSWKQMKQEPKERSAGQNESKKERQNERTQEARR